MLAVPPQVLYLAIVTVAVRLFAIGFTRMERIRVRSAATEPWRRILELGIIATIWVTFFYSHYYYLSLLILPMHALLVRFTSNGRWWTPG